MTWLFEDPTTLIVGGILIELLLAVALVKSGRWLIILAMAGVLALAGLGVLIERLVVTDREQVEDTLSQVTAALTSNDIEGVLRSIDPAAVELRAYVKSMLPQARITDARIYDLVIHVNRASSPPSAEADFTGRVKGRFRGEAPAGGEGMALRRFTLELVREGDRWLIASYQDRGALGARRED